MATFQSTGAADGEAALGYVIKGAVADSSASGSFGEGQKGTRVFAFDGAIDTQSGRGNSDSGQRHVASRLPGSYGDQQQHDRLAERRSELRRPAGRIGFSRGAPRQWLRPTAVDLGESGSGRPAWRPACDPGCRHGACGLQGDGVRRSDRDRRSSVDASRPGSFGICERCRDRRLSTALPARDVRRRTRCATRTRSNHRTVAPERQRPATADRRKSRGERRHAPAGRNRPRPGALLPRRRGARAERWRLRRACCQEMHTAPVGQIRADASYSRLFTVSADKTMRIWRLTDLHPIRTVHLPAEPGPEGTPYALAVDAPGRRVYVAGITGWAWDRATRIYVIDADLGAVVGSVVRFDNDVVVSMDLSPDGTHLAVGLGHGGLSIVDIATGAVVHADPLYNDRPVTFVHYARTVGSRPRRLTAVCVFIGADMTLVDAQRISTGPAGPRVSRHRIGARWHPFFARRCAGGLRSALPRGRSIGCVPRSWSWTPRTPKIVRVVHPADAHQQSLCCIAWSTDSTTLFVNGDVEDEQSTPVYRLIRPATGELERWDVGEQQIANMLPLPGGGLVLATTTPSIVKVDADGTVSHGPEGTPTVARPDNIDFRAGRANPLAFKLSADGRVVELGRAAAQRFASTHARMTNRFVSVGDFPGAGLHPAKRTGRSAGQHANGLFRSSQHHPHRWPCGGVAARRGCMELGGARSATDCGPRHAVAHPSARRRRSAVAGLGTAAIHSRSGLPRGDHARTVCAWWSRWATAQCAGTTSRRLASCWASSCTTAAKNWVAWLPDGRYASSPGGDHFLGWLVNRTADGAPDIFRAAQFERTLVSSPTSVERAFAARSVADARTRSSRSFRRRG